MEASQRQLTERLRAPGGDEVWVAIRTVLLEHALDPERVVVAEMTDGGPEAFDGVEMETYDGVVVSTADLRVYRIQVGREWQQRGPWVTCRWWDVTEGWQHQSGFRQQIEAALADLDHQP